MRDRLYDGKTNPDGGPVRVGGMSKEGHCNVLSTPEPSLGGSQLHWMQVASIDRTCYPADYLLGFLRLLTGGDRRVCRKIGGDVSGKS